MDACRSLVSLVRRAGRLVLLALMLSASACSSRDDHGSPDGAPGQPQPGEDLSVVEPPPADAAVGPSSDLGHPKPPPDMAKPIPPPDMAKRIPPPDMAKPIPPPDMAKPIPPPRDVTFYVVADTHADPPPDSYDLRATAHAINAVAKNGQWPSTIDGTATGFKGGKIAPPAGVVLVGDITGWGTAPTEIPTFRRYFERGNSADSIEYPAYIGLGNHDIDSADRSPNVADDYRAQYWAFVDSRHRGPGAPVPVAHFDSASHAYSWDFAGVHMIQTHRFAGDHQYGLPSSLSFLRADLASHAADGRPVFIFHHYGMDAFGTQDRWWTDADRTAYRDALRGYNVAGIITGHTHYAMQYTWQGLRVFQVNNAKAEINTGNNDGNGSFAIVRITDDKLDIVTCRWLDDTGRYELIAPWFSGTANPGPALRGGQPPTRPPHGE
jgi:cytolysin (calcineurin-like family phosphatase)